MKKVKEFIPLMMMVVVLATIVFGMFKINKSEKAKWQIDREYRNKAEAICEGNGYDPKLTIVQKSIYYGFRDPITKEDEKTMIITCQKTIQERITH